MLKSATSTVFWVGRATVFLVGLAVIVGLVVGLASTALGANGGNFILGQNNTASLLTKLSGQVPGGAALQVVNTRTEPGSRGLQVNVAESKPPIQVNAAAGKATNLNVDKLDGKDATEMLPSAFYESVAAVLSNASGSFTFRTAQCDPGDRVVSGGINSLEPTEGTLTDSAPTGMGTGQEGWRVGWKNSAGLALVNVSASAVCADFPPTRTP